MFLQKSSSKLIATALSGLFMASSSFASPYSFGGACQSQGSWTAAAQAQAESLRRIVLQLKDNPNCKGIESVLLSLDGAMGELNSATNMKDGSQYQSIPKDMEAMREVVKSDSNSSALESIFNMSLDVSHLRTVKGLAQGTARASDKGLRMLEETLNILPAFTQCLDQTNQGLAMLGASLHLTNAFLQSGEGVLSRLGNTVSKFVTFLRDKKYADRLRELNEAEYMTSISCLMETTADTYCSVSKAYDLLSTSRQDIRALEEAVNSDDKTVPLEGYFLMVREVPIVTEWLQSVLYGVEPRTPHDASFKQTVQDNVNNFVKSRYSIMGVYNYELTLLSGLSDPQAKKNHVLELIGKLLDSMNEGGRGTGAINFYFKTMRAEMIPFYLLGRSGIPERVLPKDGSMPMRWTDFMRNTGQGDGFISEFDDPEALAMKVGDRLRSLMDQSLVSASDYFRQQLIIDLGDLVARSVTSQTFSVFESLQNIRNYLDRMANEILAGQGQKVILPNVLDTVHKIDLILNVYEKNREIISNYQDMVSTNGVSREFIKEEIRTNDRLKKSYEEIISNVYLGFNMLYQRDTFLTTRLSTFVRADYAYKTRNQETLTEEQKLVLTLSGKNLIERLMATHDKSPDLVALDLANAQVINANNINVTGKLFDDALYNMILKLKLIEDGVYNSANMTFAAINHYIKHTYQHPQDIIMGLNPKIWWNMLFNGARYRVPALFDYEHISAHDNSNGSFAKMRAKLCTQSLMFSNRLVYRAVCSGTKLTSEYTIPSKNIYKTIEIDYDSMLADILESRKREDKSGRKLSRKERLISQAKADEKAICAFKNYKMQNRAYWLLKKMGSN